MLDKDRIVNAELLLDVHKHGFSRILVYSKERSNVIGTVKLRDFALITPEQYDLIVKHVLEFHSHPFGRTKTIDSLYATVGIITREDVFEEMLQREMIEDADFFIDNHRKIQRKRTKTMNFTALAKRPIKGPSISLRLKIAVFQFLSTMTNKTLKDAQEFLERLLKMKAKLNNVKDLAC
ncbi:unnamed protein product [Rotaria magnacalcarata]|uniref:CBS domain-containing protein n=1 Tax=Rotaria magnacalcarata TaxID=392030 RepID=A0A816RCC2_9BILA|nr:unnamed protein product [Rotaria magnacalcarata]CAF2117951.1 unnamed protein product [Rotaria magnacalcarata]